MPISSSTRGSRLPLLASGLARRGSDLLSSPHQIHPYLHPGVDVNPSLFPYASAKEKQQVRHLDHNHEGGIPMNHSHHDREADMAMSHHEHHNPEADLAMSHPDHHSHAVAVHDSGRAFLRETAGLVEAISPETVALRDGDTFELRALPVHKRIGDATVRMLAYNGSIPGPTLRVPQGGELTVDFTNETDIETTVHWHGLRLDNRFDGVPEGDHRGMQPPILPGGSFRYRVRFPDPGVYWYHPHIREDYAQELGLYGNIVVVPSDPAYWSPANRELTLTFDDILIEGDDVAPYSATESNRTAMGRFGNVILRCR